MFGVTESGCYGTIDVSTGKTTLFIPHLPAEYQVIMGTIHPPEHFQSLYNVDEVCFTEQLFDWLQTNYETTSKVYLLQGQNTDSKSFPTSINFKEEADFRTKDVKGYTVYNALCSMYNVDMNALFPSIVTARVTKSEYEKIVMWYVSWVSSKAHIEVMRSVTPHMMEYELESTFLYQVYKNGGCRHSAYTCICGTGMFSCM